MVTIFRSVEGRNGKFSAPEDTRMGVSQPQCGSEAKFKDHSYFSPSPGFTEHSHQCFPHPAPGNTCLS